MQSYTQRVLSNLSRAHNKAIAVSLLPELICNQKEFMEDFDHISERMSRIEQLIISASSDKALSELPLDGDFVRLIIETRSGSKDFFLKQDASLEGGFVVLRAIDKPKTVTASARLLDLPDSVVKAVSQLAEAGMPLRVDLEN